MLTVDQLVDFLKTGTAPDRYLDVELHCYMLGPPCTVLGMPQQNGNTILVRWIDQNGAVQNTNLASTVFPSYTLSGRNAIDFARKLFPDGEVTLKVQGPAGAPEVRCRVDIPGDHKLNVAPYSEPAVLARLLCAAAIELAEAQP